MTDDATLLRRYSEDRAQEAFAELVRRHLPLVYSAAVRRLGGDVHRAEDVAQVVFCAVAREAPRLSNHATLTGWLYTATRNAVIDVMRTESRRQAREQEAHIMQQNSSDPEMPADWSRLRPVLDAAMDELGDDDREAVLLRFFQSEPFARVGAALGLSEDAARKRVDRALDKLRAQLGRHKIASTSAALATLLASETISAAPVGLAASATGAALAAGSAAVGAFAFMTVTKLQLGIAAAVIAGGAVGLVTQHNTISLLRESVGDTQQQVARLATENVSLAKARAVSDADLMKLRAEVARLQKAGSDPGRRAGVPGGNSTSGNLASSSAVTASRAQNNPARLARYHERFDNFVRQRALSPEQADKLFDILGEWDDVSVDFQNSIRAQGLVWTPEAQKMRNALQRKIEVEPLIALLGPGGDHAYFDFESSTFYRALVEPLTRRLAMENLSLTAEETTRLVALAQANLRTNKPDATSMGSETAVDWPQVVNAAGSFLSASQLVIMRAYVGQRGSTH